MEGIRDGLEGFRRWAVRIFVRAQPHNTSICQKGGEGLSRLSKRTRRPNDCRHSTCTEKACKIAAGDRDGIHGTIHTAFRCLKRDGIALATQPQSLELTVILTLLRQRRRRRLRGRPFPKKWLTLIQRDLVFFHKLSAADRTELLGHIQV